MLNVRLGKVKDEEREKNCKEVSSEFTNWVSVSVPSRFRDKDPQD